MMITNDFIIANDNQRQLLEYQRRLCVIAKDQISYSDTVSISLINTTIYFILIEEPNILHLINYPLDLPYITHVMCETPLQLSIFLTHEHTHLHANITS